MLISEIGSKKMKTRNWRTGGRISGEMENVHPKGQNFSQTEGINFSALVNYMVTTVCNNMSK